MCHETTIAAKDQAKALENRGIVDRQGKALPHHYRVGMKTLFWRFAKT
jgi:hypothetical protein